MGKREILNFNYEWLYLPEDCSDAKNTEFDDAGFEKVSVPHANTVLTKHKGEGGDFQRQIEAYRFVSWYRKHFTLTDFERILIEFEAVATIAEVFVNGCFAGIHKGAYTGFTIDITDFVKKGDNVIAVRVDSTKHTDVPPEGDKVDYCLFGGIVRNVKLIKLGSLYIKNAFLTCAASGEITAEVSIAKHVENGTACIEMALFDMDNKEVLSIDAKEENGKAYIKAHLENPKLWGIDSPYLYKALFTVKKDGEVTDTYETRIGIRDFEFKNAGLMLNGEIIKIMGINRHEQWPWQGRAVPDKLQIRDADMIKETGFNAVRCSHYPQSPAFLDRCDEIGLIVFEEAPGWQHVGDEAWQEIYKENIREMIERDYNHPSIFSWGVRVNESDDCDSLYEQTNDISHKLDATRPTHGTRRQDSYEGSNFLEDIYTAHYIYPKEPIHTPFIVTEHSWDCWGNGYGYPSASDEQALAYTKDFADKVNYYYGNDNCAGGFAWSMFDYNNEVNYTRTENVFYSGLYDIFRLPKMVTNLYISQKDAKKCGANVYIANYWDDDSKPLMVKEVSGDIAQGSNAVAEATEGDAFSVTVMSNCDSVELYINSVKVEREPTRQYLNLPHPFFVFDNIEYEPGEVTAIGYIDGTEAARYTQKTPLKAAKLTLIPDYDSLIADGSDMTQVTVTLVDKNGTRLPCAENEVKITVKGAGDFIGEEEIKLEGGRCAFIVKSRYNETGDIECTVSSEGIESGKCVISALDRVQDIIKERL